jgi:sterol desaturase/sphingolipid hydroxylase (fatty acid hydroxylase superfamily)
MVGEVTKWRIAAVTFLSTVVLSRGYWDVQLAKLWTYLLSSSALPARVFRTDSYEWCLAVAAFGIFIHAFGYADRLVANNPSHPWRKFRLQDRYEADKLRRKSGPVDNMPSVQQSPWHWGAWLFEFWVYVTPLVIWDIVAPRRHRRIGGFAAPTTMGIMRDVSLGLLLYDFFFFFGHLAMHKIPFLYKHWHKKHHAVDEVRACDQVRLTLGEQVYDVGCSIVALNLLGVHPVARSLYNLVIVFLLCELHSGFDFPWTPQNVIPKGLMTGSRRHHYHHRFGHHYYQKFFFTVDRLFGFYQKDDGSLKGDTIRPDPYIPTEWKGA